MVSTIREFRVLVSMCKPENIPGIDMMKTFECPFREKCLDFDTDLCRSCVHSNLRSYYEPRTPPVVTAPWHIYPLPCRYGIPGTTGGDSVVFCGTE